MTPPSSMLSLGNSGVPDGSEEMTEADMAGSTEVARFTVQDPSIKVGNRGTASWEAVDDGEGGVEIVVRSLDNENAGAPEAPPTSVSDTFDASFGD